jgi:hypothetical protein
MYSPPSPSAARASPTQEEIAANIGKAITALPELLRQLARSVIAANRIADQYERIASAFRAHGIIIPEVDLRVFFQRGDIKALASLMVRTGILDLTDAVLVGIEIG